MNLKSFIQRHQIASYFVLTYTISWLGALLVVAPNLISGSRITTINGLIMFPVMLLGPSIAGIAMTAIADGKSGLRDLRSRMGRWRVGGQWYATILIPPVLIMLVLLALSTMVSPDFTPRLFLWGLLFGIPAGFLEEIGWTGYAFPKMCLKQSPLRASLLLGVLWGLWHLPVIDFLGAASPHGTYWLPYALAFIVAMIAMRVLIAWVYSNTSSVLLAQLIHISSTGSLVMLSPTLIAPAQEALWYWVYAGALWVVVAIVTITYGKRLMRKSLVVAAL